MENIVKLGVVSKLGDKFWGDQRPGDYPRSIGWGPIENAMIVDMEFCKKPTDMTYNPANTHGRNPHFDELSKPGVELILVKKTVATSFEFL